MLPQILAPIPQSHYHRRAGTNERKGTAAMDNQLLLLAAVPITGFLAGFINTLAGSGSLITLPMLILVGLPANVANGTNRVGILIQNIVAVSTFRHAGVLELGGNLRLIVPTVLGSIAGAALAVDIDERVLHYTVGVLMLVMLPIVILRPRRFIEAHADERPANPWIQLPVFFAIGVYGGFIQAGVGIFLTAGLVLAAGHNLVGANGLKNLIVLVFTIAALAVFIVNDQVRWGLGLLLGVGNAAGAFVAARMAIARGAVFVRWVLIVILAGSAIALLSGAGR